MKQRDLKMKQFQMYERFLERARNPLVSQHIRVLCGNEAKPVEFLGPASMKLYQSVCGERRFDAYGRPIRKK